MRIPVVMSRIVGFQFGRGAQVGRNKQAGLLPPPGVRQEPFDHPRTSLARFQVKLQFRLFGLGEAVVQQEANSRRIDDVASRAHSLSPGSQTNLPSAWRINRRSRVMT